MSFHHLVTVPDFVEIGSGCRIAQNASSRGTADHASEERSPGVLGSDVIIREKT